MLFDLGRRIGIAGLGVGEAEVAADDEGAQAGFGEGDRLLEVKTTDHLHRGKAADTVMHGAYHRAQVAAVIRESGGEPAYTDFIHAARQGLLE